MVDINLLQDTTGEGDEQKKPEKKPTGNIEYTKPSADRAEPLKEAKPKTGFLGGIFKKKTTSATPSEPPPQPPRSARPAHEPSRSTGSYSQTEPRQDSGQALEGKPKGGFFSSWFGRKTEPSQPSVPPPVGVPIQPSTDSAEAHFRDAYAKKEKSRKTDSRVLEEKVQKKPKREIAYSEMAVEGKPSFLDVNLMPGDLIEELEPKKKLTLYGIVTAGAIAVIIGLWLSLSYYEKKIFQDVEQASKEIQSVEAKIASLRKLQLEAILFKSQTDQVKDVLDKHVHWSNFFKRLEERTAREVVYEGFNGTFARGTNPVFILNALAPSFDSVARQTLAFRAPESADFIASVTANAGERVLPKTAEESAFVKFGIQISVYESAFYQTGKDESQAGAGEEE